MFIIKRNVNLNKYNIRSDLVLENISNLKIKGKKEKINNILIETISLDKKDAALIKKKEGLYTTISFTDITDSTNYQNVLDVLTRVLKRYLKDLDYSNTLIIGLGNKDSTADSLGPKSLENILVTRHIYLLTKKLEEGYTITSKFIPDVFGNTGYETKDLINALKLKIKPTLIIIIDSLCASSIKRINKTIQISNAGINPGSGVGNSRGELSKKTLKTEVLSIGIPTVVESVTIVKDTINLMFKQLNNNRIAKEKLLGIIGTLEIDEIDKYLKQILNPFNYNLVVSAKEIDFLICQFAKLISTSINKSLHNSYKQ